MSYAITAAQREHVTSLSPQERHFHCVDKIVEHKSVWTLQKNNELQLFQDEQGTLCVPIWPHPDYAEALATGTWENAQPHQIKLDTFLTKTLPSCTQEELQLLVFPTSPTKGALVAAKDLWNELTEAQKAQASDASKPAKTLNDIPELPDDFIAQL